MKNNSKYAKLTQQQVINELIKEFDLPNKAEVQGALSAAIREGWLRGEEYGYDVYGEKTKRGVV
jgi:hypothetical protein